MKKNILLKNKRQINSHQKTIEIVALPQIKIKIV